MRIQFNLLVLLAAWLLAAPCLAQSRRPSSSSSSGATNRLASVPHMYGDFGGFGGTQIGRSTAPLTFLFNDGTPFDTFVQNTSGNPGAGNPMDAINVLGPNGVVAFSAIGQLGIDRSGDGIPDTYQAVIPLSSQLNPNAPSGIPLAFQNGQIFFVAKPGPNSDTQAVNGTGGDGWNILANYVVLDQGGLTGSLPNAGSSVRIQKIAENNSPLPRDRVFFNFNHFRNVPGDYGDVNRYTVGVEKTFQYGSQSLEVRVPFASTLASNQELADGLALKDTEFGDATLIWKKILLEHQTMVVAGGLGVSLPFADDTRVSLNGVPVLSIDNKSFNLLPYFAAMLLPTDDCFVQAFVQLDVDANGNPVAGDITGLNPTNPLGRYHDQTVLFADVSIGCWLLQDPEAPLVTGIMPMFELHYATSTSNSDTIDGGGFVVSSTTPRFDQLNATAAVNFVLGERLSIRPALVVPLRDAPNRDFDLEAGVQVNAEF